MNIGGNNMHRYWNIVIRPVLEMHDASNIVEIGCLFGDNTRNIVDYCLSRKGVLYAIDPFPQFDAEQLQEQYKGNFEIYRDLSLSVLPTLKNYDAVLIDGDHNWYTVINELKIIVENSSSKMPLIFVHDVGWPYARRDLYYNPENVPPIYRHPYKKAEISPSSYSLVESGGINGHLNNAIYENNSQNGVLTAVEDFIAQSRLDLEFFLFPGFNGLGILVAKDYPEIINFLEVKKSIFTSELVKAMENERILQMIKLNSEKKKNNEYYIKIKDIQVDKKNEIQSWNEKYQLLNNEYVELNKKYQLIEQEKQRQIEWNHQLELELEEVKNSKEKKIIKNLLSEKEAELKEYKINAYKKEKSLEQKLEVANRAIKVHLNSYRYQLGDTLISSLSHPKRLIKLPANIIKLLANAKKRKKDPQKSESHSTLHNEKPRESTKSGESANNEQINHNESKANSSYLVSNHFVNNISTSIIIPVYNAFEDFIRCIESVERNTHIPYQLIIVNDCSTDDRVKTFLEEKKSRNFIVINNDKNLGYVESVNVGIKHSRSDVVLLNSDTIVTSRWLEKLKYAAYSAEDIGTVTPLSNAAGAFSVPKPGAVNDIPQNLGLEKMGVLVENLSQRVYPDVPTGNGFCMYIKKQLINEIGLLDSVRFKRGYGEENDFCMRALKAGWKNIIDDATFIYHKRSASFSDEKNELIKRNRAVLDELHPEYTNLVKEAFNSEVINRIRSTIKLGLENELNHTNKKRILYVLHDGAGGTPNTNKDLMSYVESEYDCFVLISNRKKLSLFQYKDSLFNLLKSWDLEREWNITETTTRDDFKEIYLEVLVQWNISLVHIRHLLAHTFDIAYLANKSGKKVLLSFHDFYFVCPTIHLLDNNHVYCSGLCTEGLGVCSPPSSWIAAPPDLKHNWVYIWRGMVDDLLKICDAFITTSQSTKDVYLKTYPSLVNRDFRIIEHGREDIINTEQKNDFYSEPSTGKPIKILVPGNIGVNKGAEFIQELKKIDRENKLEIHFLGNVQSTLKEYGVDHGTYKRHEFYERVKEIKPTFIGIFSIWPETYCHTLTEAWQCGVPVLASKIGTIEERINNTGCGWFIDFNNPQESYRRILNLSEDLVEYRRMIEQLKHVEIRTAEEMSRDYIDLYINISN